MDQTSDLCAQMSSILVAGASAGRVQMSEALAIWDELERRRNEPVSSVVGPYRPVAGDVDRDWLGQWVAVRPQLGTIVEFQLVEYRINVTGEVTLCRDAEVGFMLPADSPVNVSSTPCFDDDSIRQMFESELPPGL